MCYVLWCQLSVLCLSASRGFNEESHWSRLTCYLIIWCIPFIVVKTWCFSSHTWAGGINCFSKCSLTFLLGITIHLKRSLFKPQCTWEPLWWLFPCHLWGAPSLSWPSWAQVAVLQSRHQELDSMDLLQAPWAPRSSHPSHKAGGGTMLMWVYIFVPFPRQLPNPHSQSIAAEVLRESTNTPNSVPFWTWKAHFCCDNYNIEICWYNQN